MSFWYVLAQPLIVRWHLFTIRSDVLVYYAPFCKYTSINVRSYIRLLFLEGSWRVTTETSALLENDHLFWMKFHWFCDNCFGSLFSFLCFCLLNFKDAFQMPAFLICFVASLKTMTEKSHSNDSKQNWLWKPLVKGWLNKNAFVTCQLSFKLWRKESLTFLNEFLMKNNYDFLN
jgi:hypothetical protein